MQQLSHMRGRRYETLHARRVLLPDDAARDRLAAATGGARLFAAAEKAQEELAAAEGGFKDAMLAEQAHFDETVASLQHQVERLPALADASKARSRELGLDAHTLVNNKRWLMNCLACMLSDGVGCFMRRLVVACAAVAAALWIAAPRSSTSCQHLARRAGMRPHHYQLTHHTCF